MVTLGCQFSWMVWETRDKLPETPVRYFLTRLFQVGRLIPNVGNKKTEGNWASCLTAFHCEFICFTGANGAAAFLHGSLKAA